MAGLFAAPIEFIDTIEDDELWITQLDQEAQDVNLEQYLRVLGDKVLVTADSDEGVLYRFYVSADGIVAGYVTTGTVGLESFAGVDEYVTRRAAGAAEAELPAFVHEQHCSVDTSTAELYETHRAAIAHLTDCVQMHTLEDVCARFVASFDRLREWHLARAPVSLPSAVARVRRRPS